MKWLIIWYSGVVLTIISFAMMVIEIVIRGYSDIIELHQQNRRKIVSQQLSAYLYSPLETVDNQTLMLKENDQWLLIDIVDELLMTLKGGAEAKVSCLLEELGIYEYLLDFLDNNINIEKRMRAIRILSLSPRFPDVRVFQIIINHREPDQLIFLAMRCLIKKDACYVRPVLDTLEKNKRISWLLVADILRNTDPAGIQELLKVAANIHMPTVIRIGAIHALQELRASIEVSYFHSMLEDQDECIRYHLLLIMKTVCPAIDSLLLKKALADTSVRVRRIAAELSVTQKQPELINVLYTALNDEDWLVTYHCACALYQLGDAGYKVLELASRREDRSGEIANSVLLEQYKSVSLGGMNL